MRSCIMTGLSMYLVHKFNVGTVSDLISRWPFYSKKLYTCWRYGELCYLGEDTKSDTCRCRHVSGLRSNLQSLVF